MEVLELDLKLAVMEVCRKHVKSSFTVDTYITVTIGDSCDATEVVTNFMETCYLKNAGFGASITDDINETTARDVAVEPMTDVTEQEEPGITARDVAVKPMTNVTEQEKPGSVVKRKQKNTRKQKTKRKQKNGVKSVQVRLARARIVKYSCRLLDKICQ